MVLPLTSNVGHSSLLNIRRKPSKNDLQVCVVDIDEQLRELDNELAGYHSPLRYRTARLRNDFFRLSNYIEGCDIEKFASHESGDMTPLNTNCERECAIVKNDDQ